MWTPRRLLLMSVAAGILVGLGLPTFYYAEGTSYLSSDPTACANCHIMNGVFDSWQKSSHHTVAACVDCHLPSTFFAKYLAKAQHGWNHSKGFTLQDFPEPLRISGKSAAELQDNCEHCHADLMHAQISGASGAPACRHCHSDVGHGPKAGLG